VPVRSTAYGRSSYAANRCFKYDASVTGRQRAVPHLKTFFPCRTVAVPAGADGLPVADSDSRPHCGAGVAAMYSADARLDESARSPSDERGSACRTTSSAGGCGAATPSAAACDAASSRSLPLLPWFMVGSHNVSESAWGRLGAARDPKAAHGSSAAAAECLVVHSYELSVLALPSFVADPSDPTDAVLMTPAWALDRLPARTRAALSGGPSASLGPAELGVVRVPCCVLRDDCARVEFWAATASASKA
jgi:hypothetical protein